MDKNSLIEWTDHTFNPWWGYVKVSPACDNCYAVNVVPYGTMAGLRRTNSASV